MSSTAQAQGRDQNRFAEQRIYLRKKVARPLPIELLPGKGVWLHDLGEGGLSVSGSSPLQLGTNTYLSFQFPEASSMIEAAGVVAWSDISGRVGVRFTRVKPDSTAALKRWLKAESAMDDSRAGSSTESAVDEPLAARIHSLDLVSELQSQLADCEDRDAALDLIAQRMLSLTRASGAAIALREGPDVVCRASAGNAPPVGMKLTLDSTLSGECFRTGNLVLLGDSENDPRVDPEVCRDLNFRSLLIHPITAEDQVTGILEVLSPLPGNFEGGDVLVLGFVAEMVASLDPSRVSPSSPVALAELTEMSQRGLAHEVDFPFVASALADPVMDDVPAIDGPLTEDVMDEPLFALGQTAASEPSSPVVMEFESLPPWVHEPPQPVIADVAQYLDPAVDEGPAPELQPLVTQSAAFAPVAPEPEIATSAVLAPSAAPEDRATAPVAFKAREAVARTSFRAHEASVEPNSRVPLFVSGGVAIALIAAGGSYLGFKSPTARTATPTLASTVAPSVPASNASPEVSKPTPVASKTVPSIEQKNPKATKPTSSRVPAEQQEPAEDEVAVTLSRDTASNSLKKNESAEAPSAPSLNAVSNASAANESLTAALASVPTTRVAAEAKSMSAEPVPAGVTGGKLLRRVAPIYPDFARRSGISGTVVLSGTVTKEGTVKHLKVISGNSLLADSAIRAVNAWRYSPFMYNGRPVETETRIVLNFNH